MKIMNKEGAIMDNAQNDLGFSIEEVEDAIALWRPAMDAFKDLTDTIQKVKDKNPGKYSHVNPAKLSFDIVSDILMQYWEKLASMPSPW